MTSFKTAILVAVLLCGVAAMSQSAPAPTQPAAQSQLSNDGLRQMLEGMGMEPKPLSKGFLIVVKDGTWTVNIQLVLSPDTTKLGMNANLGTVESPDGVTAAQWKALMISNGDIDPSSFYFDDKLNRLLLHRVMDNRYITPAYLRSQIDNFAGNVKGTEALWKFTK